MRKVLIVSPHFPPINAPDHQRVRTALPFLAENNWSATVLAVDPTAVEGFADPLLEKALPTDARIERTAAFPIRWTRVIGLGDLALRALPFLWRVGNKLLSQEKFDLVFFSTTVFPVTVLGPLWKRKFQVPYVIDFQDPWRDDSYKRKHTPPPGGKLRYALSRLTALLGEPYAMSRVAKVVSVSPAYSEVLLARYPFLQNEQFTTLPFGAPEYDFARLDELYAGPVPATTKRRIVYIGRGGHDLSTAVRLLFSMLSDVRETRRSGLNDLIIEFIGTSYALASRAQKTIEPLARDYGLEDVVRETTSRIPYFEALATLRSADGLLIIGSDSPSYSPSKIYPYVLARRPTLAILHRNSPAVRILRRCGAATIIEFDNKISGLAPEAESALVEYLNEVKKGTEPSVDWATFSEYSARAMTRKLCAVFDQATSDAPGRTID